MLKSINKMEIKWKLVELTQWNYVLRQPKMFQESKQHFSQSVLINAIIVGIMLLTCWIINGINNEISP